MRLRLGLPLLLAFLMLTSTIGAQSIPYTNYQLNSNNVCAAVNQTPLAGPNPNGTAAVTIIALDVSFSVVALGYLFSKFVPAAGISNWIRNEYYELTKSILIVIVIYSAITFVSGLGLMIASNPGGSSGAGIGGLITESEYYLCQVQTNLASSWNYVGQVSFAIGMMQNINIGLYLPIPLIPPYIFAYLTSGFAMQPYHGFMLESGDIIIQHFESTIFDTIQFVLFPVTAMVTGLAPLLPLLIQIGLAVLIPLGLVFRAFPFVRGVGGTLIAIGIATSLIFPATLILLDQPVAAYAQSIMPATNQPQASCSGFFCNVNKVFESMFNSVPSLYNLFQTGWAAFDNIYFFFNGTIASNFYMVVQLLLLAINLIIIYQLTDSIAKALGGSVRLSLGNKLKLA